MIFFLFFFLFVLYSIRSLLLFFKGKSRLISLMGFFFYLVLAIPLTMPAFSGLDQNIAVKLILMAICIGLAGFSFFRRLGSDPTKKKKFSWKSGLEPLFFLVIGLSLASINAIENLSSERPILKIRLTGAIASQEMEWKNPGGPLQHTAIKCHEVVLENIAGVETAHFYLPGDLIGVRAKTFRFHPLLNALGISTKYRLDMIYTGYRKAENYSRLPVLAHPLSQPASSLNSLLFKYWESFFCKEANAFWVHSCTLESNYFPMTDEFGKPIEAEYYLSLSSFGLSAF
ncbi:MAG: hypothetical protein JSS60_03740 [Verrucomicrobia bacterium]|nr:hypothetical protein [Verrucomicrobiota bacterium]